jgi:PAS domain S-box-containing protein
MMEPSAKFLNSLFEVAHVEFQTYDLDKHKLIFSSGLAHKLLGYTEREYYKFSRDFYMDLVHPDDRKIVFEAIDKIRHASKSEIVEMTVRLRRRDGVYGGIRARWFWTNMRPAAIIPSSEKLKM